MKRVMIVDDTADIVTTLDTILQREGIETHVAYNGEDFLSKVDKVKPDLVLLDVMMPGLTTHKILEKLNTSRFADLKVILVTVVRLSDEEQQALKHSFNVVDYVTKPFDIVDLAERVKQQLAE